MKYLAYQEIVKNVTYSLYVREVDKKYIYDIEVKTLINKNSRTKTLKSITTDCQKSFLILEMLIRQKVSIDDLIQFQKENDINHNKTSNDNKKVKIA